jgi:hypothetical protein
MDTKTIREIFIPAIATPLDGEIIAYVAELKADELLVQTELLEENMNRLLGDIANRATRLP